MAAYSRGTEIEPPEALRDSVRSRSMHPLSAMLDNSSKHMGLLQARRRLEWLE